MGEIRIVGPGKTLGYPYLVCNKRLSPLDLSLLELRLLILVRFKVRKFSSTKERSCVFISFYIGFRRHWVNSKSRHYDSKYS